jgi:hypothetical protein
MHKGLRQTNCSFGWLSKSEECTFQQHKQLSALALLIVSLVAAFSCLQDEAVDVMLCTLQVVVMVAE